MMEYPHTIKNFTINGVAYRMWAPTLLLTSQIEDDNYNITFLDILTECTDLPKPLAEAMAFEEIEELCKDAIGIGRGEEGGKPIKAIDIIAILLNRGHVEPQKYRMDFVQNIFKQYQE